MSDIKQLYQSAQLAFHSSIDKVQHPEIMWKRIVCHSFVMQKHPINTAAFLHNFPRYQRTLHVQQECYSFFSCFFYNYRWSQARELPNITCSNTTLYVQSPHYMFNYFITWLIITCSIVTCSILTLHVQYCYIIMFNGYSTCSIISLHVQLLHVQYVHYLLNF